MDIRNIIIVAAALSIPVACSHDRRDSETPDQMTPANGTTTPQPVPSTTNEPGQPGSPDPMNNPPVVPGPNNTDAPSSAPNGTGTTGTPGTGDNSLRSPVSGDALPSGGGAHGSGGSKGTGGSGGSGGSGSSGRHSK